MASSFLKVKTTLEVFFEKEGAKVSLGSILAQIHVSFGCAHILPHVLHIVFTLTRQFADYQGREMTVIQEQRELVWNASIFVLSR